MSEGEGAEETERVRVRVAGIRVRLEVVGGMLRSCASGLTINCPALTLTLTLALTLALALIRVDNRLSCSLKTTI